MHLRPDETELIGSWIFVDGKIEADETLLRIEALVDKMLRYVARGPSGWSNLYSDPQDGRYWESYYPQGGLQGGGPMSLRAVPEDYVREQYGDVTARSI